MALFLCGGSHVDKILQKCNIPAGNIIARVEYNITPASPLAAPDPALYDIVSFHERSRGQKLAEADPKITSCTYHTSYHQTPLQVSQPSPKEMHTTYITVDIVLPTRILSPIGRRRSCLCFVWPDWGDGDIRNPKLRQVGSKVRG